MLRITTEEGSHNSGKRSIISRQNDREEERPDSRVDLLVDTVQSRTGTGTWTDTKYSESNGQLKMVERINLTWAEMFHKAQLVGKTMRSSFGPFSIDL